MTLKNTLLILIFSFISIFVLSQNVDRDSVTNYNPSKLNTASQELLNSISNGDSNSIIASRYYDVAIELIKLKNYSKAEIYLQKAIEYASKDIKNNPEISEYYRQLAKVQEIRQNRGSAADNYQNAWQYSNENIEAQINLNDANRMVSSKNAYEELDYLNQNCFLLSNTNESQEIFENYNRIADINMSLNQPDEALGNYNKALSTVDVESDEALQVKSNIANLLIQTNNYEDAITIQEEVVKQSSQTADINTQIEQMRKLSNMYFSRNISQEGLQILQEAYDLAIKEGDVSEARESLIELVNYYKKTGDKTKIISLYDSFVRNLDSLILKDESLIDARLFEISEHRIKELEEDRIVKDKMIERKDNNNLFLLIVILLFAILIVLIVKAWLTVKKRNNVIALQSLRKEMNPHFIFNSLNSVNQFIANSNELEANKYLSSYSQLMRNIVENSNKDFISLSSEIEQLKKYLELERIRFPDKFSYNINIDERLDQDVIMVPNMIIQPNLENAVWHGLRYRDTIGFLNLSFSMVEKHILVEIEDNGIGIEQSKKLKTKHQSLHKSRGLKNINERISLLNKIYRSEIKFEIKDKSPDSGVKIKISWKNEN